MSLIALDLPGECDEVTVQLTGVFFCHLDTFRRGLTRTVARLYGRQQQPGAEAE